MAAFIIAHTYLCGSIILYIQKCDVLQKSEVKFTEFYRTAVTFKELYEFPYVLVSNFHQ